MTCWGTGHASREKKLKRTFHEFVSWAKRMKIPCYVYRCICVCFARRMAGSIWSYVGIRCTTFTSGQTWRTTRSFTRRRTMPLGFSRFGSRSTIVQVSPPLGTYVAFGLHHCLAPWKPWWQTASWPVLLHAARFKFQFWSSPEVFVGRTVQHGWEGPTRPFCWISPRDAANQRG